MNPVLRSSSAHVFAESIEAIELDDTDRHHLLRVLRLRDGEPVTVSDGAGRWRATVWSAGTLEPAGEVQVEPSPVRCCIATAIPKGDRLDWMVQKLTEVGVSEIRLVQFARSVVRWQPDREAHQLSRLGRIVREAAMQSRRVWLPTLSGPEPASGVLALAGAALADPSGDPLPLGWCTVIGPEGGVSPAEAAAARRTVSLGDTVLRVETAALVAAVRTLHAAPA